MFDYIFDLLFYQFPRYIYAQRNCKICCRFIIITFCNTIISIENFVSYLTLQFLKPSTVKLKLNLHFFVNWIVQFIHHKISRTNPVLFTLEILPLNHTKQHYCLSWNLSWNLYEDQDTLYFRYTSGRNDVLAISIDPGKRMFQRFVEACRREGSENRTNRWKERTRERDIVKRRFRVPARKLQMRRVSRSSESD